MDIKIAFSDDPGAVLNEARDFLVSQPVLHNLILTILHARVDHPEPGRYWMALENGNVTGVVLQSPLSFPATLTPMESPAAAAVVHAIVDAGISLPGINGEAATAASFAGQWAERTKSAAKPFEGNRLYELMELGASPRVGGNLRQADPKDRDLLVEWTRAFSTEVHEPLDNVEVRVDRAMEAGQIWVWDQNGEMVSMAVGREPVERVVRVAGVYTPHQKRGRGYAEACVHALSKRLVDSRYRCALYTDLGNPTSNAIYRRIGYKAVAEILRYRFEKTSTGT